MLKKAGVLFFIGTAMLLINIISCDPCGGPYADRYKLESISFSPSFFYYKDSTNGSFSLGNIPASSIFSHNLALGIGVRNTYFFSQNYQFDNSWSIINTSYACSPNPATSDEMMRDIQIYSNTDFDGEHPKNTDLAPLFDVILSKHSEAYRNGLRRQNLVEYTAEHQEPFHGLLLVLNSRPEKEDTHTFTLNFHQFGIDIDFLEVTAEAVMIKP
ncbi:MAG: hypothetical protein DRI71_11210 [Bacteroidetes bacterium]|nr:MAG: hypothetical protein DRI71_11210 [Bacteroidota bacterium]